MTDILLPPSSPNANLVKRRVHDLEGREEHNRGRDGVVRVCAGRGVSTSGSGEITSSRWYASWACEFYEAIFAVRGGGDATLHCSVRKNGIEVRDISVYAANNTAAINRVPLSFILIRGDYVDFYVASPHDESGISVQLLGIGERDDGGTVFFRYEVVAP